MSALQRTLRATVALVRAGMASRWRLRGKYWRWRMETAFGDYPVNSTHKLKSMIDYGAWVGEMNHTAPMEVSEPLRSADE